MKKREVYTFWKYPCEGEKLHWEEANVLYYYGVFKKKKDLLLYSGKCPCGKGCKPIKCRIIVENEV